MSYLAIKWTYTAPEVLKANLKPADLAVLRALCWFWNDERLAPGAKHCFPGIQKIAKVTGNKVGAVNGAKKRLAKAGLISWNRAANFPGEKRRTNIYRINCPALLKKMKAAASSIDEDAPRTLRPGMMYIKPNASVIKADCAELPDEEVGWLCEALEFVCDRPENRVALLKVLSQPHDFGFYKEALARVRKTSKNGRPISNRLGYLLKALRGAPKGEGPQFLL